VRNALGELARETHGPHEVKLWPWGLMRDLTDRQRDALRRLLEARETGEPFRPPPPPEPKPKPRPKPEIYVNAGPLAAYLRMTFPHLPASEIALALTVPERRLRPIMAGTDDRVTLAWVDKAVTRGLGRPDLLNQLYPVDST
jgi:hypothetical protein